jgi:hypothetical protein
MRTEGCLGCWVCDTIDQKHCNVSILHVYLEFLQKLLTESPSFDRNLDVESLESILDLGVMVGADAFYLWLLVFSSIT